MGLYYNAKRYRFQTQDGWGTPQTWKGVRWRSLRWMRNVGGEFRLRFREHDEDFGPARPPKATADRLDRLVKGAAVGTVVRIKSEKTGNARSIRVVQVRLKLPVINTVGNSKIDYIYTYVVRKYKGVENWGMCSRRSIAGTNDWSQHSPWPSPDPGSNAWDLHHDNFKTETDIAEDLIHLGARESGSVGRVIHNRKVWTPSTGNRPYTGSDPHTTHIHTEGLPYRTGYPRSNCP